MADLSEIKQELDARHLAAYIERQKEAFRQSVQQQALEESDGELKWIEGQLSRMCPGDSLLPDLEELQKDRMAKLAALRPLDAAPIEPTVEPPEITSAPAATENTERDARHAKIRDFKLNHKLRTYGDVAKHMNKGWNHRSVIDKFIAGVGRPQDAAVIWNALAKRAD